MKVFAAVAGVALLAAATVMTAVWWHALADAGWPTNLEMWVRCAGGPLISAILGGAGVFALAGLRDL